MSIVISPVEIKVKGIPLSTLENIGFEYKYVYYEPDVPNYFKIVNGPDNAEYRVDLTDEEKAKCASFLESWVAPTPEPVAEPVQVSVPDEYVSIVSEDGTLVKVVAKSELKGDETVLNGYQISTRYVESWAVPAMKWNAEKQEFEGINPTDKRAVAYMSTYNFGDQFDLMWKAFAAIKASGVELPAEVDAALTKMQEIKATYPK